MDKFHFTHSFKAKRQWQHYHDDSVLVSEIFQAFDMGMKLKAIEASTNVPANLLSKWRKKYRGDPQYRPGARYGVWRRKFTQEQEEAIADFLRIQYIIPGIVVKRKHLRTLLFELWKSYDPEKRAHLNDQFSYHFVSDFCERNDLSFRKMRKKKRSILNQQEVEKFAKQYFKAMSKYPPDLILNMDETPWNFVFMKGQVLAERGKEEVSAQLPEDYRKSFTVIATITNAGTKHPPIFFAQGKTSKSHQQFDEMKTEPHEYELWHSDGGHTNEDCMIHYLQLVKRWVHGRNCALILDRYKAHLTSKVKNEAKRCNIKLIYIPTSGTDEYQPLDRRVFGILKSMGQSSFDDFLWDNFRGLTKSEAADMFVSCWKRLSSNVICESWNFALNDSSDYSSDEKEDSSENWEIESEEGMEDYERVLNDLEDDRGDL